MTTALLLHSIREFHTQIIKSEHDMLDSELSRIAEEVEFKLLERDLTFFDLGLPEITSNREDLLEEVVIEAITIPKVIQVFAYESNGTSILLSTGGQENKEAKNFAKTENLTIPQYNHLPTKYFSMFFRIEFLEMNCILEVQLEEDYILEEWKSINGQVLEQGFLIILIGTILLFVIFRFMSARIQHRENQLESKNQLLVKTNQKLAQVYKTVSLGALTGHLMHSLKTPLTRLQMIAKEAELKKAIDPNELYSVNNQIRELVSHSLHSLQEIEDQKKSYTMTVREIFEVVLERTSKISTQGKAIITENQGLDESLDNLQTALLIPILVTLVENAFQADPTTKVSLASQKLEECLSIHVSDTSGGIPESERESLFQPKKSRKKGGTGLGLAIAQQLALSIGANFELLRSDVKGSEFKLELELPQDTR
jgi:signal transduction histidine kinase